MKKKIVPIILLSSVLLSGLSIHFVLNTKESVLTSGYTIANLPTTIQLSPCTDTQIKNYYSSLDNLDVDERSGTSLLKHLKLILKNNHKYYSYDSNTKIWQMYEITDRDWDKSPASSVEYGTYNPSTNTITNYEYSTNDNIKNNPYVHALYINRNLDNQTKAWGNHEQDAWGINQEHIWAKSHGFDTKGSDSSGGARGDPMHLWAGNGWANHEHSNYFFAFVDKNRSYSDAGTKYQTAYGNLTGYSLNVGGNQTVFEPQDCDKGDIARAIFYMAARYNYYSGSDTDPIDGNNPNLVLLDDLSENTRTGTSSASSPYGMGFLSDLLAWHKADPVDEYEIRRNNLLYKNYTSNRNPFIDYPEWVDYIWGTVDYNGKELINHNTLPTGYVDTTKDVINGYRSIKPATGVTLNKTSVTLNEGSTTTLVATVTPSDATNKDVTWSSSNTSVVTVSSSGKITAKNSGNAIITVTTVDGGFTATCNVKVDYEITSITASCPNSFHVGDRITRDDIEVLDNKGNPVTDFIFVDNNYQFKYVDAESGGKDTTKIFSVSYGNLTASFDAHVSREKFALGTVSDVLDVGFTGATSGSYNYVSWSEESANKVNYIGNNAGNYGSIQLRSNTGSGTVHAGIVTSSSIGNVKKITVVWDSHTTDRTLDIYGKNTSYSSQEELYDDSTCGTLISSIKAPNTVSDITGDFAYIGVRSQSGAIYVSSLTIEYAAGVTATSLSNYIMYEDTYNQCETKTDVAIGYFDSLTDQEEFMTSEDYVIATARTRFKAWLAHEGKEIVSNNDGYVISNSSIYLLDAASSEDNNMIIMVLIASSTLIVFTTLLIIKKKRRK